MKKVVVVGVSASGKTSFAKQLGEKIALPVTYLDAIMWKPGWEYIGDEATIAKTREVMQLDSWLIEGFIMHEVREELFLKADTIVYLDYPGWLSAWRYLKRTWRHRKEPRPELPGSPESFNLKFFKTVLTKGETWKLDELLETRPDINQKVIRFTSPRAASEYLASIDN